MYRTPAVLLVLIAAARPASAQLQPDAVAGCYDLEIGTWSPEFDVGMDSMYMAVPPRIRLQTVSAERSPGGYAVAPAPGALPSPHRYARWRITGSDSVRISWTTGYSGVWMELVPRPDGLEGRAHTFWDFERQTQTASVTATSVACDAPLPEQHQARHRIPRGIALQNGDSLRIGEPLPAVSLDSVGATTFRVTVPAVGIFANATDITVSTGANGVGRISLAFPADTDYEALVARMTEEFGPPADRDHTSDASGEYWSTSWWDRLVIVHVRKHEGQHASFDVHIRDPRWPYGNP